MTQLTDRETELLQAIIEEYISNAEAVGSETIEKKYPRLGVSPATIRNEMAKLTKLGYLKQLHTSAGRIPTPAGLRFYINQLMKEREMSTAEEVAVKDKIWDYRDKMDGLLREATHTLAERTQTMAVATTDQNDIYFSGAAYILDMPEFYDIDLTRSVLSLVDKVSVLQDILLRQNPDDDIQVVFGEDLSIEDIRPCGLVFARFETGSHHAGAVGIIGPARLNYSYIIPMVRYINGLLGEIVNQW